MNKMTLSSNTSQCIQTLVLLVESVTLYPSVDNSTDMAAVTDT